MRTIIVLMLLAILTAGCVDTIPNETGDTTGSEPNDATGSSPDSGTNTDSNDDASQAAPDENDEPLDLGAAYVEDSGFDPNNPVESTWDGVSVGAQSSYPGTPDSGRVWIRWDLGSVHELTSARIHPDLNGTWITSRYTIEVRDESEWIPIVSNSEIEEAWIEHELDIEARHVRLVVESETGRTQFREFELTGTDTGRAGSALIRTEENTGTAERVGSSLFVTREELTVWRERAQSGPYRTEGDAGHNSPGDWDRITTNANRLEDSMIWTLDDSWRGSDGCVEGTSGHGFQDPESRPGIYTRDAAFVALVEEDDALAQRSKSALLAQAREPSTDFGNTDLWCHDTMRDINPNFQIAIDVAHRILAYDYLNAHDPNLFTGSERAELESWFEAYGELALSDARDSIEDNLFVDPDNADYTYEQNYEHGMRDEAYAGGPRIPRVAYWYNNRRNSLVRTAGMAGLVSERPDLTRTAAQHCEEWIRFSVFPEGFIGEFERSTERLPDLGWAYSMKTVGPCLTLADTMARTGDASLYEYSTIEGLHGAQGAPERYAAQKNLYFALRSLLAYEIDEYERYTPGHAGDANYRIDSVDPRDGSEWHGPHKVIAYPSNLYFEDPDIRAIALSQHPDSKGLPPYAKGSTNEHGSSKVYEGEWGVYPGVLFMYGGLEDVNP